MKTVKWYDEYCIVCGRQINSWDKRCGKALAHKECVCEECLSVEYDMEVETFRRRMEGFFGERPCMGI